MIDLFFFCRGGITLNFNGTSLNVAQNPAFIYNLSHVEGSGHVDLSHSQSGVCIASDDGRALSCTVPPMPDYLAESFVNTLNDVPYDIIMDAAPGPNWISLVELKLRASPNPLPEMIRKSFQSVVYNSGDFIEILVSLASNLV